MISCGTPAARRFSRMMSSRVPKLMNPGCFVEAISADAWPASQLLMSDSSCRDLINPAASHGLFAQICLVRDQLYRSV